MQTLELIRVKTLQRIIGLMFAKEQIDAASMFCGWMKVKLKY